MKNNKNNSNRLLALTTVYCVFSLLIAQGDEYERPLENSGIKIFDSVLSVLDVKQEITKAERDEFDKKFIFVLASYSAEKGIDGDVQSKDFYKKLDAVVFDKSKIFPIQDIISNELCSVHVRDGCTASIFDNLNNKQKETSIAVDGVVEELLKLHVVKRGNAESKKYMRAAILFSMINDKNAFYFGANFLNKKASIPNGGKVVGFGNKDIELIVSKAGEDYSLFSKKYNEFLKQFDAYSVKNGVASRSGVVGNFDSLSKEVMATRDSLLGTTAAHSARINWGFIRMLWLMKTYAKSSSDNRLDELANGILSDIKNKSQYPFVKQWAEEAALEKNRGSKVPAKIWFGKTLRVSDGVLVIDANGDKKILVPYDDKEFEF